MSSVPASWARCYCMQLDAAEMLLGLCAVMTACLLLVSADFPVSGLLKERQTNSCNLQWHTNNCRCIPLGLQSCIAATSTAKITRKLRSLSMPPSHKVEAALNASRATVASPPYSEATIELF